MTSKTIGTLLALSACTLEPIEGFDHSPAPATEQAGSWTNPWQVFPLTGTRKHYVHLAGEGQISVEAGTGTIKIYGAGTTWASGRIGRVTRRWLPAGTYTITLTGASGVGVIETDVYGQVIRRTVSDGVVWERLVEGYPAASVNVLSVAAWRAPDVGIADDGTACRTTSKRLRRVGATAGMSGTFSRREANGTCMQHAGAIRLPNGYSYGELGGDRGIMSLPSGDTIVADDIWDAAGPYAIAGSDQLLPYQSRPDYPAERHPRAVLASRANGDLLMMTIDGRTPAGGGATLVEAAEWAARFGAVNAINLDGGGSATMWIEGATRNGVVNYPSDGHIGATYPDHFGERELADAVAVW